MNNKNLLIILLMGVMLSLTIGCEQDNFFSAPLTGKLGEKVLSSDSKGINMLLTGAYAPMHGTGFRGIQWQTFMSSPDNWIYGSVMGGDAHKGSHSGDQPAIHAISNGNADPAMGLFNNLWRAYYEGVVRTNDVLRLVGNVEDMAEAGKDRIRAEARFLRGHYYFQLARIWKNVPWVDETTIDPNQPNDNDIWLFIADDFKFAMENLPLAQSERGRPNSWAAASYLAKTYMYMKEFQKAKILFDDIIANGQTSQGVRYDLFENFQHNFNPRYKNNNPEGIFQVQMIINDDRTNSTAFNAGQLGFPYFFGPHTCCGFFQPAQDLVNSYRVDENGLPLLENWNNYTIKNDMGITSTQKFEVDQTPVDPRVDWTVARRGVPFMDWGPFTGHAALRDQTHGGPYHGKKNSYFKSDMEITADYRWPQLVSINYNIIRFADLLLMAAEAEIEVGSLSKAAQYVNRVRNRAANKDGWVTLDHNKVQAFAEVDSESELFALNGLAPNDWVVRNDTKTTWQYMGGSINSTDSWSEYKLPNYKIGEYPTFSDKEYARKAVHFERKLELAMEGHRFFDLVRWDTADEVLNGHFYPYESTIVLNRNGRFTRGKNEYFPIPQRQIDLSEVEGEPKLIQNPGY